MMRRTGIPGKPGKCLSTYGTEHPFKKQEQKHQPVEEQALEPSGELAIPIMESIAFGKQRRAPARGRARFSRANRVERREFFEVPYMSHRERTAWLA
jgi:hypothetical protein